MSNFELIYIPPDILVRTLRNGRPFEYTVRGCDNDSCSICGKPKVKKNCQFHKTVKDLPFRLIFGGYYEVSDTREPINEFTQVYWDFLKIRYHNIEEEILEICLLRFRNTNFSDPFTIKLTDSIGTWIPTSNFASIVIARAFFQKIGINIIDPACYCLFNINEKDKRLRYTLKNPLYDVVPRKTIWIIFDDLYHKGNTMCTMMEIIKSYDPVAVIGLTILRTGLTRPLTFTFPP